MDNYLTAREILESYEDITIEKQILDGVFMIKIFEKEFLMFCPEPDIPESRASIYLYNDEGFDFPHIMLREHEIKDIENFPEGKYRWVCLYEQESIVNSIISFEDKIIDVIDRLIELLTMSESAREKEFQKEFMFYWNSASEKYSASVYLKQEDFFSRMNVYCSKSETRLIEAGVDLSDLNARNKDVRIWQQHIENNVFFIPITDNRDIIPPHRGYSWSVDDVRDIICGKQIDHVSLETYEHIKFESVSTQDVILVFLMKNENSKVTFAAKLRCKNISGRTLMEKICSDALSVEPISTVRKDYFYLSDQIGNDIGLRGKKILLVGGGSLGSYVAFELVKNGVSSLIIYDGDNLTDANIMRWAYAGFGKKTNKATLISFLLEILHPEINVTAIPKDIDEKALVEEAKQVDMIVFTIGSSDSQLKFNHILRKIGCSIPVIYVWIEAGGKFSHILTVEYEKEGCYQCLFTTEDGRMTNNRASVNDDVIFDVSIIRNGCGGTRAAYGTAVILRTVAVLLDTIQRLLSGEISENTLINITPEKIEYPTNIVPMKECKCCGHREE